MIKVLVNEPIKVSGHVSCKAFFQYDQAVVDFVKTLSGPCVFHKKIPCWEFPIYDLSEALDGFSRFDQVDLTVMPDEISEISESPLTQEEIQSFRVKPYAHQVEAVNYGLEKGKWLNLSGMGLGKTFEAMCLAETLHRRGLIDHCMIICGVDSLRQNWKSEIQRFSHETVRVLGEKVSKKGKVSYDTLQSRAAELKAGVPEFFTVVNITNVRDDAFVEAFQKLKGRYGLVVFDECHRASKHSQQGQNLLKLNSRYKVAMTGTLITNSPVSAYLPLAWTENDHATLTNFKAQYCNFGGFGGNQIVGYKNLWLLNDEISRCGLRRTFDQVRGDMPKKTVEYEVVEMSDKDRKFYDAIKNGVKEEADKIELNTQNLLALMTRLRQATSCPTVLTSEKVDSTKLCRCVELAEDLLESGEKVVIMSNFRESAYDVAARLERFRPCVCTGDQSEDQVSRGIEQFRTTRDHNVVIGTHGKIGTGFSMPECHYMICVDTPYTSAQLDQSTDRIYRITSEQPVYIKILVDKDTVDERVREIVETKRDLSDYMIDGKPTAKFGDALRSIIQDL